MGRTKRVVGARVHAAVAGGLLLLLLTTIAAAPVDAQTLMIAPEVAATGRDDAPKDDVYDSWSEGDFVVVLSLIAPNGLYERRGVYEFDLAPLAAAGAATIETATLRLPQSSAYQLGAYYYAMRVYGYAGDGAIQLSDFELETGEIGAITVDVNADEYTLDVTAFVQARFAAGEWAGFNLVSSSTDMQVVLHDDAVEQAALEVTYAPAAPVPALGIVASVVLTLGLVCTGLGERLRRRAS